MQDTAQFIRFGKSLSPTQHKAKHGQNQQNIKQGTKHDFYVLNSIEKESEKQSMATRLAATEISLLHDLGIQSRSL